MKKLKFPAVGAILAGMLVSFASCDASDGVVSSAEPSDVSSLPSAPESVMDSSASSGGMMSDILSDADDIMSAVSDVLSNMGENGSVSG